MSTSSSPPPPPQDLLTHQNPYRQPLPIHVETIIRITAGSFLAYCLAYASGPALEAVLPWSMQWLVGLLGPLMVMRIPPLACSVLGSISVLYTGLLWALISITVLLAAASVHDGWFILGVAVWTLWVSGLRYGKAGGATNILTNLFCAFLGMVGLGLHRVVRDGVFLRISHSVLERVLGVEAGSLPIPTGEELSQLITPDRLADIVYKLSVLTDQDVILQANGPLDQLVLYGAVVVAAVKAIQDLYSDECLRITIPFGTFEGQEAGICLEESTGDLTIGIAGGDFWIGKFWSSGVMNPLAVFPNLIVTVSWVFICGYASVLLPLPFIRTLRYDVSRITIPQALYDTVWFLANGSKDTEKVTGSNIASNDNNTDTKPQADSALERRVVDEETVRKRLMKAASTLSGGNIGIATMYEPRFFDNCGKPPLNTWKPLKELASTVEQMALKTLAVNVVDPIQSPEVLKKVISDLQRAAKALEDPTMKTFAVSCTPEETSLSVPNEMEGDNELAPSSVVTADPFELANLSESITNATHDWMEAMCPTDEQLEKSWKDGAKHVVVTGTAWVTPGLLLTARLFQIFLYPFQLCKSGFDQWNTEKSFQCIKFTIGFVVLVSLSVFVDDYRQLTVTETETLGDGSEFALVRGNPPSSFSNWDLLAYVFATMPTTEGTVKKSILRILGTCLGGLSAWGLVHATGDNAVGSVAWLTVTTALGAYLSVDKHDGAARFGTSKDFGYGGFYLVLVQTVIVMEAKIGLGEINELVANRVVSNIFGILMANCLALVPPRVMGSTPRYTKLLLEEATSGLEQAARRMVYGGRYRAAEDMHLLKNSFQASTSELSAEAKSLLEDAKRLNRFPFFRVDSRLEDELNAVAITCSGIGAIMAQSEALLKSWGQPEGSEPRVLNSDHMEAMKSVSQGKATADLDIDPRLGSSTEEEKLVASFLLLQSRLADHKTALEQL